MSKKVLHFEDLPEAMAYLIDCADRILSILQRIEEPISNNGAWMDVDQLIEYLPNHPARTTIYSWSSRDMIPSHRVGKMLGFLRSEIDDWIKDNSPHTNQQKAVSRKQRSNHKKGGQNV